MSEKEMRMKHTQMRENTGRAIMDAFWKLYRERPIEKISVKEICETAGYNRATFYCYVPAGWLAVTGTDAQHAVIAHASGHLSRPDVLCEREHGRGLYFK